MPPDPNVHTGVCAVVEHDGAMLMVQRGRPAAGYGVDGTGTWAFPGGWLEHGENPYLTALRECREETGVEVQPNAAAGFTVNRRERGDETIVTLFVRAFYVRGEPTVMEPDKCPVVRWIKLEDVDKLPLFAPVAAWWDRWAEDRTERALLERAAEMNERIANIDTERACPKCHQPIGSRCRHVRTGALLKHPHRERWAGLVPFR